MSLLKGVSNRLVGRIGTGKQMMVVEVGANSKGEIASIRVRQ